MAKKTKKKTKQSAKKADGNGSLTKELWQAAVNLRGSIEPADYKRYVLPIIFLRFLSLRYEQRRAELEKLIADPKSDYHSTDPGVIESILEDPDEYASQNIFVVPAPARWSNILKNANADDIAIQLDNALAALEDAYPDKLKGLLPKVFAGSNMSRENITGLINLFSKDVFKADHGGADRIGQVYEYFIGEFANSEGKRGGEYFTPESIVKLLVAMLEPESGIVYDPCCGSGGMFVQSDIFTKHSGRLSFYGQESKDFTYRLCRMNMFIHGIDGNVEMGNTYSVDKHGGLKADYILANPPFNDGSKGENGWGADRIPDDDPRIAINGQKMPLAVRNANTMWMMHFLHHLRDGGTAGFVMATGELSNTESPRLAVRKALVDLDYVDCVVRLSGKLFANTQIPCVLWFFSRNRQGGNGFRKRAGEVLFINGANLGKLREGSRRQKELSSTEIAEVAELYRRFKRDQRPEQVPGFCAVGSHQEIEANRYSLTPGRYVGAAPGSEDDADITEALPILLERLNQQLDASAELSGRVRSVLAETLKAL